MSGTLEGVRWNSKEKEKEKSQDSEQLCKTGGGRHLIPEMPCALAGDFCHRPAWAPHVTEVGALEPPARDTALRTPGFQTCEARDRA